MTRSLFGALTELVNVADHAVQQSDRWLFIMLLIIVLAGGLLVIRYLVRRDEEKSQRMHESYDKNTAAQLQIAGMLTNSTSAIERSNDLHEQNTHALKTVAEELRRCQEKRGH